MQYYRSPATRRISRVGWSAVVVMSFALSLSASQSLVLTTNGPTFTFNEPSLRQSQSWRIEFQLHDFKAAPANNYGEKIFWNGGVGAIASIFPDGSINLSDLWDLGYGGAPCVVTTTGKNNVLVRFQRDVARSVTVCELWNFDGTGYNSQTIPFGTSRNYNPGARRRKCRPGR